MSTVLNVHNVERITIQKKHHSKDEDCHEFMVIRIETTLKDGRGGPTMDLFMNRPKLCVRASGKSLIERSIEVAR